MKDQAKELLKLFKSRPNEWIPVYEIANIALQYNTRIKELRAKEYDIESKIIAVVDRQKHTAFRYNKPVEAQETLFDIKKITNIGLVP